MNGEYADAVSKIKNVIENTGFEISKLLFNLNNIDADNSTIFSTNAAFNITKIDELFIEIGKCCNLYNYDLLLSLLHSIKCEKGIKILEKFTQELQLSIIQELDLSEYKESTQFHQPGIHTLIIKYTGNKCTIEKERLIRSVICECFHLKTWSFRFYSVQDGCIALVYGISSAVKSHLLQHKITANAAALLKKSQIESIIIDNTVLKMSRPSLSGFISDIMSPLVCEFKTCMPDIYIYIQYVFQLNA